MLDPSTTAISVQRFCTGARAGASATPADPLTSGSNPLDPLGPPLGCLERLGEVVGLPRDLPIAELHNAHAEVAAAVRVPELDLERGQVAAGQGAAEPHRGQAAREVLVDGDRVVAADDALPRLGPLLYEVLVQEAARAFPVARRECLPHRLGDLAAVPLVHIDPPKTLPDLPWSLSMQHSDPMARMRPTRGYGPGGRSIPLVGPAPRPLPQQRRLW